MPHPSHLAQGAPPPPGRTEPSGLTDSFNALQRRVTGSSPAGLPDSTIAELIINLVNFLLGISAVIALAVLVWGGISYIIALGDTEKAGKAKKTLLYAIIGLLVIGASFAIVATVRTIFIK